MMSLAPADYLFAACYFLSICSFLFKSMFLLRLGVLIATIGFVIFSVILGNAAMIFWNGVFVVVNAYQLVRLILEMRRLDLGPDLETIRNAAFTDMSQRDFLSFWNLGNGFETDQGLLTQENFPQGTMYFLVDGQLDVVKDGGVVATISANHFVGEMSFMTGDPASADTRPSGKIRVHEWSQEKIRGLREKNPELFQALLTILGRDLSRKLGRVEASTGQTA